MVGDRPHVSASRFNTEKATIPQLALTPSTTQKLSSRYILDPPLPPELRLAPKVVWTQALDSEVKFKSSRLSVSWFAIDYFSGYCEPEDSDGMKNDQGYTHI